MVSVCISLMTDDIEHLCMCLLTVCVYSVEKCLFGPFAHCELACPSVVELYFCRVAPHQIHDLQIFCHIQWVVFSYSCSPLSTQQASNGQRPPTPPTTECPARALIAFKI